jgi:hypothetical protein
MSLTVLLASAGNCFFAFDQQTKTSTHDLTGRGIAPFGNLPVDELRERVSQSDVTVIFGSHETRIEGRARGVTLQAPECGKLAKGSAVK